MKKILLFFVAGALVLGGCDKEFLNPSTVSQDQAVSSGEGLTLLSNGLQARYATGGLVSVLYNKVALSGLSTNEFIVLNQGNVDENNIRTGGASVINDNAVVRNFWTTAQLVRANADLILANANNATDPGTRSGVVAYASIFRALTLGDIAQFFEQTPLATGDNAPFVSREEALRSAVTQLEAAATQLAAAPVSAEFTSRIVPGIDLANTLQALIARYSLVLGDYDKALAAAGRVNLASRSVFNFNVNARNPLFDVVFSNKNIFEPTDVSLGLSGPLAPASGDGRIPFLVRAAPLPTQNRGLGFYTANEAPIPVYVPGEMLLIRAEAYARKGDLTNAVIELNKVRTKPATANDPLGANLPAYSGPLTADAILLEILRNRYVELAFQGFRLGDSRRFGRPGPAQAGAERNRNFYPYPRIERENNGSTPADPAN